MKNHLRSIVLNRRDVINIVCELGDIGLWIENLVDRDFQVSLIKKIDPVHQIGDDKWNIVAEKKQLVDDTWFMKKGGKRSEY